MVKYEIALGGGKESSYGKVLYYFFLVLGGIFASYLLPFKSSSTLDIFSSSHAKLEEIIAALNSGQRKSIRFLLVIILFLPCS